MSEQLAKGITVHFGDCLAVLPTLPENSIDSCVTDPPYHLTSILKRYGPENARPALSGRQFQKFDKNGQPVPDMYGRLSKGFMGKKWDGGDIAFRTELWAQVYRVLKPGAHLLAFGGTRTYHRMACAIEDAGFEIRDCIQWLYGSGFPKSHDVSKGIDRLDGVQLRLDRSFRFTEWMRSTGLTAAKIDEITNTFMGSHYTTHPSQPAVATRDLFEMLRPYFSCGVPEWVERLVDERTVESENFKRREHLATINGTRLAVAPGQGEERGEKELKITAPATDAARQWQGWGTALKPAVEILCLAQKPHDIASLCGIMAQILMESICQLPSHASAAERYSLSNQSVFGTDGERVSAQWNAVLACNSPADLFALMDTSPFGSAIPSSLSIALSWLAILVECSTCASMFTIETATSLITDLKTLNCLLSKNTPDTIIEAATQPNGTASNASAVVSIFSAVETRLNCTRAVSVLDPAILTDALGDLRPNCEPIVLARKPLSEKTVAANVLRWGTGALNIDGCRVEAGEEIATHSRGANGAFPKRPTETTVEESGRKQDQREGLDTTTIRNGRWPANVIHDGSDEVVAAFPESSVTGNRTEQSKSAEVDGTNWYYNNHQSTEHLDSGSSARFFYTAKADSDDRLGSRHPTVKPLDLMQYLVRLVTPKGGTVLDPFAGTGTVGEAACYEGCKAVLIEREQEYIADIQRRMRLIMCGPDERRWSAAKARQDNKPLDLGPLFDR